MVATRAQEAAQRALLEALAARDTDAALQALASPAVGYTLGAELTPLHWAAAFDAEPEVLDALVAAGVPVDAPLPPLLDVRVSSPPWLAALLDRAGLDTPVCGGSTALAIACSRSQLEAVRRFLQLGTDANGAIPAAAADGTGTRPLAAAVLAQGSSQQAVSAIVGELLRHGADPLASPSRLQAASIYLPLTILRLACSAEKDNGALPTLLDHLELQAAAGRLAFRSADVAVDVMATAARGCRPRLFCLAHDYAVAAAGLRRVGTSEAGARTAASQGKRAIDSESDSEEEEEEAAEAGGGAAGGSGAAADGEGQQGGPGWQGEAEQAGSSAFAAAWRPQSHQLVGVLRGAAAGGSLAVLRCVLSSPLPFASERIVRTADTDLEEGLLAGCAMHAAPGDRAAALALLAGAGARLYLDHLLRVIDKWPCGADSISALLDRACEDVAYLNRHHPPTTKVAGVKSWTCPIHRLLCGWRDGTHELAREDPAAWDRGVTATLEALLAAGFRPIVFQSRAGIFPDGRRLIPKLTDPFDSFPVHTAAARRMVLVAKQGRWSTDAHACWAPGFKASVRALLLASHRLAHGGGGGGSSSVRPRAARRTAPSAGSGGATLGCLPAEVLVQIVAQAALPMSAWR